MGVLAGRGARRSRRDDARRRALRAGRRRSMRGGAASRSSIRSSRSARISPSPRTSCSATSRRAAGWIDRDGARARARRRCSPSCRIRRFIPTSGVGDLLARRRGRSSRSVARSPRDARVLLMDEPTSSLQGADVERLFALIRRLARARHRRSSTSAISSRKCGRSPTLHRAARRSQRRHRRHRRHDERRADLAAWSAAPAAGLFPARTRRVARRRRALGARPRRRRRGCATRASSCVAARSSASPGLLGSGRTELVRALFGLDRAARRARSSGTCRGAPRQRGASACVQRRRLLSEDRKGEGLALPMSIADNLCATRPASCARGGMLDLARAGASARATGFASCASGRRSPAQAVRALSGGNQQKVAIGRLLHQEARRAAARRADARHRHRQQVGRLRGHRAAGRRRRVRGAGGELVPAGAVRALRSARGDVPRTSCRDARPIGEWTPETVLAAAIGGVS